MANSRENIVINQKSSEFTEKEEQALDAFLENPAYKDKNGYITTTQKVDLTNDNNEGELPGFMHTMFKRPCKKNNLHYEVLSPKPMGIGKADTHVYRVEGTFKKQNGHYLFKNRSDESENQKRVAKQKPFYVTRDLEIEYNRTIYANAAYLNVKEPAFFKKQNTSFLTMNLLEGKDLIDLLIEDRNGTRELTTDERIDIFLAIIEATEELHKYGVHRDLKPENIKILLLPDKIIVRIFDFEMFKRIDPENRDYLLMTDQGEFCGSPSYVSPEMVQRLGTDESSDDHALALIGGVIFRAAQRNHEGSLQQNIHKYDFPELFSGIETKISYRHRLAIKDALSNLYGPYRNQRCSKTQVKEIFTRIKEQRNPQLKSIATKTIGQEPEATSNSNENNQTESKSKCRIM